MAKGWSLERQARQAKLIRQWRPWENQPGRGLRRCFRNQVLAAAA